MTISNEEIKESGAERFFAWPVDPDGVAQAIAEYSVSPEEGRTSHESVITEPVGKIILSLKERRWSGKVELASPEGQGSIVFHKGKVVQAIKDGAEEEETLMELIKWDKGTYILEEETGKSPAPAVEDEPASADRRTSEPLLDAVLKMDGVLGVVKVAQDGVMLASTDLNEEKINVCSAGVSYCGNAADTIGKVWNLGIFLHGAIVGKDCKLLLHQDGEDFLGTNLDTKASARHIGPEIERILKQRRRKQ